MRLKPRLISLATMLSFASIGLCAEEAVVLTPKPGPQLARDLWRQKDLGVFRDGFKAAVPRHGVVLVRLRPGK